MRIAIVGAGICGLAAARYLENSGRKVVLFEKNATVGGRVATKTIGEFTWDTGATSIAPRGKKIEKVLLEQLSQQDLVRITKPIYVHSGLRVSPGHPSGTARFTYETGIATVANRLAEGLDVRLGHNVESIEPAGDGYEIRGEVFDAVILTPPIPQTSLLLWNLGESRPMANVRYRACLSILLGYKTPLPPTNYHALIDVEQIHPMTWLSLESVKSPSRAPEGGSALTVQLSASYSLSQYDQKNETLVGNVVGYIQRLYGASFQAPDVWDVVRWKYSQPESFAKYEHVNRLDTRLLVASDALLGGHIEDAFEVGTRVAEQLVEQD